MIYDNIVLRLEDVRRRVDEIITLDHEEQDPETAHQAQDRLYEEVLRVTAHGHPQAGHMAHECLRVAEAAGTRWYA